MFKGLFSDIIKIMTALKIENLTFAYPNGIPILDQLDLEIRHGEIAAILGPSGCGKTTLFHLIAGILKPLSGKINFSEASSLSYMTQEDMLLPWRNVLDNVLLPFELGHPRRLNDSIKEQAVGLLDKMGLSQALHLYPAQISGGMRQRVGLCRVFLEQNPILLLDEPFGSLDTSLRKSLYSQLLVLQKANNTTVLLITHDLKDAVSIAKRIFLLEQGKIIKEHCPEKKLGRSYKAILRIEEEFKKTRQTDSSSS